MGMEFTQTWLRQVSTPASHDHFNHCVGPKNFGDAVVPPLGK